MIMIFNILLIFFLNNKVSGEMQSTKPDSNHRSIAKNVPTNDECVRRIYSACTHPTTFTEEEIENVRQFLNHSFSVLADIKPDKPLCPKLHVRHDWKCLTEQQKTRIINVWKRMYKRGDVQKLTDLHVKYWPAWHKTAEFPTSHRWFTNEFEIIMKSIDPKVSLPYWDYNLYGSQPERSSVWDVLGHSGNYSNGYCVRDGMYRDIDLIPCLKRHWSPRETIYPWFTPEVSTLVLQSPNLAEFFGRMTGQHFQIHINIGGYEGQYAVPSAPYDVMFFMHHMSQQDNVFLKWQLQNPRHLTPLDYNVIDWKYNMRTGYVEAPDIATDYITGVPGITVREMFWFGFGELCSITDQLITTINDIKRGIHREPTAIKRMRALPKWILKKYFPQLSANYSGLYHQFEEVGKCNTRCHPIPKPTLLSETEIGRRQLLAFAYDNGQDYIPFAAPFEQFLNKFREDMNGVDYCSPYVTSY